jgi:hypothetical protein
VVKSFCDSVARYAGPEESNNDMTSKKRRRHTPDQIRLTVRPLRRLREQGALAFPITPITPITPRKRTAEDSDGPTVDLNPR